MIKKQRMREIDEDDDGKTKKKFFLVFVCMLCPLNIPKRVKRKYKFFSQLAFYSIHKKSQICLLLQVLRTVKSQFSSFSYVGFPILVTGDAQYQAECFFSCAIRLGKHFNRIHRDG